MLHTFKIMCNHTHMANTSFNFPYTSFSHIISVQCIPSWNSDLTPNMWYEKESKKLLYSATENCEMASFHMMIISHSKKFFLAFGRKEQMWNSIFWKHINIQLLNTKMRTKRRTSEVAGYLKERTTLHPPACSRLGKFLCWTKKNQELQLLCSILSGGWCYLAGNQQHLQNVKRTLWTNVFIYKYVAMHLFD